MSLIFGMAVLFGIAMVIIWAPPYTAPEPRHPHMRAMDRLAVCTCETCGAPTDAFGYCLGACQGEDWDR